MSEGTSGSHQVVGQRFRTHERLGSGSFGEIYVGVDVNTGAKVAMKFEKHGLRCPQLRHEYKVYRELQGCLGVCKCAYYGTHNEFNVMVLELLGPSLEELFTACGRRFSLKTTLKLADQLLERVETLHDRHLIHRDIKPANFVMGDSTGNSSLVYCIDFGLSKRFRNPTTLRHNSYRIGKSLTGTPRYASIYNHLGVEQSRRDDLEAVGYVLVYFLKGRLPWQGLKAKPAHRKYKLILEKKQQIEISELCRGCPDEFAEYLTYCRYLRFEADPDIGYLRGMFRELYKKLGHDLATIQSNDWDWNPRASSSSRQIQQPTSTAATSSAMLIPDHHHHHLDTKLSLSAQQQKMTHAAAPLDNAKSSSSPPLPPDRHVRNNTNNTPHGDSSESNVAAAAVDVSSRHRLADSRNVSPPLPPPGMLQNSSSSLVWWDSNDKDVEQHPPVVFAPQQHQNALPNATHASTSRTLAPPVFVPPPALLQHHRQQQQPQLVQQTSSSKLTAPSSSPPIENVFAAPTTDAQRPRRAAAANKVVSSTSRGGSSRYELRRSTNKAVQKPEDHLDERRVVTQNPTNAGGGPSKTTSGIRRPASALSRGGSSGDKPYATRSGSAPSNTKQLSNGIDAGALPVSYRNGSSTSSSRRRLG